MSKQKIYLAGPFFNSNERKQIKEIAKKLRQNYEVFVPMEHFIPNGYEISNREWGLAVFKMDTEALLKSDFVVALDYGFTSDTGTAWEIGFAYANNIPTYVVSCVDCNVPIHSIMTVNGCVKFFNNFSEFELFLKGEILNPIYLIGQK